MAIQGTRADVLSEEYKAISDLLRGAIVGVPDEMWQAPTSGDGRQINVVAHHAAGSHAYIARQIQAMADGQPQHLTMDQIHAGNAQHAREFAGCSRTETLELHDRGVAEATTIVRGLSDEQLAREGEFISGVPGSVEQAVQRVLIGHPREHTATIQATLATQDR
jgi:Mycothiol maleylpyruvate isomerase N-terminal domain